jgi:hypothetical protein
MKLGHGQLLLFRLGLANAISWVEMAK